MSAADHLLTLHVAAPRLGIKPRTLRLWCQTRRIECVRMDGGHYRIRLEVVENYVQNRTISADPTLRRKGGAPTL